MHRSPAICLVAALLTVAGCSRDATRSPEPAPEVGTLTEVPAGTVIEVSLDTTLNSGSNEAGDRFVSTVVGPLMIGDDMVIPTGSTIRGEVDEVRPAHQGAGRASLTVRFTELELPDGYVTPIVATLKEETGSKKKRNGAIIGGSAAGGALLGRVLGHGSKDALLGAVVGGAIGTGVVLAQEGEQVHLPSGTTLALRIDAPLEVPSNDSSRRG